MNRHANGAADYTDEGEVLDKLRSEAGKLGAHAVHFQTIENAGTGERVLSALFGETADRDSDAAGLRRPWNAGPGKR